MPPRSATGPGPTRQLLGPAAAHLRARQRGLRPNGSRGIRGAANDSGRSRPIVGRWKMPGREGCVGAQPMLPPSWTWRSRASAARHRNLPVGQHPHRPVSYLTVALTLLCQATGQSGSARCVRSEGSQTTLRQTRGMGCAPFPVAPVAVPSSASPDERRRQPRPARRHGRRH
jgi:hypothetical protein